jgi:virginiamycin B lyase
VCHGPDWLSTRQFSSSQWNTVIDDMIRKGNVRVPGSFSAAEREVLVDYLTQNFGPKNEPRRVAEQDMDVDEAMVAKAMYVEYQLPPLPAGHKPLEGQNADDGDSPEGACRSCGPRRLHDPHIGNDGSVWYADQVGLTIGKIDPRTATFKDYLIEDPTAPPHGLTMDQKGQIWFTSASALGRLDPETGKMRFYKRPSIRSGGNTPTVDAKGDVWYTGGVSEIAKWDHSTDKVTFYKTPSFEPQPYGMVTDKHGKIWFAMLAQCKVVRFDPAAEQFTEYSTPYSDRPCTIRRLSFDHDGMLWYGLAGKVNGYQKIGRIDPETGKTVEYTSPYRFTWLYDVQADPDNNIWIPDSGEGGALVKFDRKLEKFIYFPMPQLTDSPKLEITRDGAIWYTTRSGDPKTMSIGVMYPDMEKVKSFAAYNQ